MKQTTLTGFEEYRKTTRRAKFLADIQVIVPWPGMKDFTNQRFRWGKRIATVASPACAPRSFVEERTMQVPAGDRIAVLGARVKRRIALGPLVLALLLG